MVSSDDPAEFGECPNVRQISRFARGMLASADFMAVSEHVRTCPDCRRILSLLDKSVSSQSRSDSQFAQEQGFHELMQVLCPLEHSPQTSTDSSAESPFLLETDSNLPRSLGQYELLELLGEGGMGSVYRGWHRHLKHSVVVKVLAHHRQMDQQAIERFLQEMEAVGRLANHPHLVRARDAGQYRGVYYIVMDYREGTDLRRILRREERLAVSVAAEITCQTAEALVHVSQCRMVHRDIKPSNLLLTRDGTVMLLDLGLATIHRAHPDGDNESRHVVGTADYIAPEQWSPSCPVDSRADIYSLGCTLFEFLAGTPPYHDQVGVAKKRTAHLYANPVSIRQHVPSICSELDEIIRRMMAKDPGQRFQSPADVIEALRPFGDRDAVCVLADKSLQEQRDTNTRLAEPTIVDRPIREVPQKRRLLRSSVRAVLLVFLCVSSALWPQIRRAFPRAEKFSSLIGLPCQMHSGDDAGELRVQTPGLTPLVAADPLNSSEFTLQAKIRLTGHEDQAGLFWGCGGIHSQETNVWTMRGVLVRESPPAEMSLVYCEITVTSPATGSLATVSHQFASATVPGISDALHWRPLEVRVRGDDSVEILLDGQPVLSGPPADESMHLGDWGLLHKGKGSFRDVKIIREP